jgi:hypothetical protein
MILHGPENVAGLARILAKAQRDAGLNSVSICHATPSDEVGELQFGTKDNSLWDVLRRIIGDVDILHLYFGRSFTGDDLADAYVARSLGKPVFMTLLGCDVRDSKRLIARGEPTMCSQCWPQGCSISRQRTLDFLATSKTPALTTTPDLTLEVARSIWLPLPVDVSFWQGEGPRLRSKGAMFRVLHAPTDEGKKGTSYVTSAIEALQRVGCPIELVLAQKVTKHELKSLALSCDIVIDQLMAGVYGTFAAEMMALGLPVIARISPALRSHYPDDLPILSAGPETIADLLLACVNGQKDLADIGRRSTQYATRVHSHHNVAKALSALY